MEPVCLSLTANFTAESRVQENWTVRSWVTGVSPAGSMSGKARAVGTLRNLQVGRMVAVVVTVAVSARAAPAMAPPSSTAASEAIRRWFMGTLLELVCHARRAAGPAAPQASGGGSL